MPHLSEDIEYVEKGLKKAMEHFGKPREFERRFNAAVWSAEAYENETLEDHYTSHAEEFYKCTECFAAHLLMIEKKYHWDGGWQGLLQIVRNGEYAKLIRVNM
jgi:hypothetical protein